MVEFVLFKIKSPDQRADGAICGVDGHERAFHLWQLGQAPFPFGIFCHAHHSPRAQFDVGGSLLGQTRCHRLQAVAGDVQYLAVLAHHTNFFGCGFEYHGTEQIAFVAGFNQGVVNRIFKFAGIGGQINKFLWSPVDLAQFVVQNASPQCLVGDFLVIGFDSGVNVQAACVYLGAVLREHELTRHLRHIVRVRVVGCTDIADFELFGLGSLRLCLGDEAVFFHALNDVELA